MNEIKLTKPESTRLAACEKAIERGINTFVEVGQALTEIRDAKLYRADHKSFEAYCKDRWEISRPRAYQLIDQAKVVKTMTSAAGANLSTAVDISERAARELKNDLPAVAAKIKSRVEHGEAPEKAVADVVAETRQAKKPEVVPVTKAPRKTGSSAGLTDAERIEELEAIVEDLTAEKAALEAKVAALEPMRLEFERGGFAEVIKNLGEQVRVLKARVETESQQKVKNLRSAEYWKREAAKLGWSRNTVIDLDTLEEVKNA